MTTEPDGPAQRSWDERVKAVMAQFPSTADRFWLEAVKDYDIMGSVIRECIKVGHTPKRRGQRPLEYDEGMAHLRHLWGDDYSSLPFAPAFRILAGARSRAQIKALILARTGVLISRTQIHRFLSGETAPSGADMEAIAKTFGKRAVYFHEYRIGLLVAAVASYLDEAPDATASLVRRLGDGRQA